MTISQNSQKFSEVQARQSLEKALGFRNCSAAVIDELVTLGRTRKLQRGEYLARRGDAPIHVWLVLEGLLEVANLRSDGTRHLLGLVLPGTFLGLVCVVDQGAYSNDFSSRGESVVFGWQIPDLQELRSRNPDLILAMERQIAYRYRLTMERLAFDAGMPLEKRVASMLEILADLHGKQEGEHIVLDVKLSQADLADWLGLSRQRVNFALRQFESIGIIRLHYASLTITDLQALKKLAWS